MTRSCAGLFLLCAFHAAPGMACAIVTPEEGARRQQARIDTSKAEALALHEEADLVFIGKLTQLTLERETVKQGPNQHLVKKTYQSDFDFVDDIKGRYAKGQPLALTLDNLVYVGCGPRAFRNSLPKENGVGEVYLVYARAGQILRTNHIPDDVQPLSGREEARHLRAAAR
ncbi:hypothetical protein [Massilia sp. Leaf139]|uniref:hypothetical protein n=1 Tax=Massilia sp. Leaf139 TaxID=1736272 RepID=UPI0006FCA1DD|nr:hypothetical protein [Massilia sp. Leaf139]KQQ89065.1 hypothetical protein ASF77_10230 [Massilia sp. Leaf139]